MWINRLFKCSASQLLVFSKILRHSFASAASTEVEYVIDAFSGVPRFKPLPTSGKFLRKLLAEPPESPAGSRTLRVAVVGAPNAGKSTFINALMGTKIVSVSSKVHTTEKKALAVLSEGNTQILFVDTPGVVTPAEAKRHRLPEAYLNDSMESSGEADVIAVIHDATNPWHCNRLNPTVRSILSCFPDKESFLVLNKVDLLKSKRSLLDLMRTLTEGVVDGVSLQYAVSKPYKPVTRVSPEKVADRYLRSDLSYGEVGEEAANPEGSESDEEEVMGWNKFSRVFMVSSFNGDGISEVKDALFQMSIPTPWKYHPAVTTDQDPKDLVLQLVREKFLDRLKKEMPYMLQFRIKQWKMYDGLFFIRIQVDPPKKYWCKYLIGPGGKRTKEVAQELETELMNLFHCDVKLSLIIGGSPSAPVA